MKLLDLLVEKLEEWPEGAGYVAQDDNGCVYWFQRKPILAHDNSWCSEFGACFYIDYYNPCTDWQTAIITREMWEEAKNGKDVEWGGTGLPPVGAVCEVFNHNLDCPEWEECKIKYMGPFVVVYESESCIDRSANHVRDVVSFRPLRTERERWVDEALSVKAAHQWTDKEFVEAIYENMIAVANNNEN